MAASFFSRFANCEKTKCFVSLSKSPFPVGCFWKGIVKQVLSRSEIYILYNIMTVRGVYLFLTLIPVILYLAGKVIFLAWMSAIANIGKYRIGSFPRYLESK